MTVTTGTLAAHDDRRPDVGSEVDDARLADAIINADRDVERSILLFRRDRLSQEARARIPECIGLPRFVTCTNWDHCFPGTEREVKVRWVFDRRMWSVVVLHVRGAGGAWCHGRAHELLDVTESLALANSDALCDVCGWGCEEASTLPRWSNEATTALRDANTPA